MIPLNGTSYAAGYVAGVAALVRSKYPQLTAAQVVQRITATAHNAARAPSNVVGAGTVDPVAALTWELPSASDSHAPAVKQLAARPNRHPRIPHHGSLPSPAPQYSRWPSWLSPRLPRIDERSPLREPAPIAHLAGDRTGDAGVVGCRARRDGLSLAIDS
ncbi:subtilase family protein [Mycobacterium xenopi 3993]|nr:subtilase family protein [Mycobacterium xenopi 3993]